MSGCTDLPMRKEILVPLYITLHVTLPMFFVLDEAF